MKPKSKVLIIAGSDSSGGAGIQADIKTVTALGSYAMTAITAITSQNTTGIKSIVSIDAKEITSLAQKENFNADIFGPLAFDNSISKKSAAIKGIKNAVAGEADVLLVPSVETGNGLVKMMIYFMGACAAGVVIGGKVPVVITSRSDDAPARLASIAAAIVALD